jgi:hypothetical protein
MHERRPGKSPRASRGFKCIAKTANEPALLFRCQHETTPLRIVLNRGEDAAVRAEIGVTHMRALDGAFQREREAAEIIHRSHVAAYCKMRGAP